MAEFICPNCGNNQLCDQKGKCVSSIKSLAANEKYVCSQCGTEVAQEQLKEMVAAAAQESILSSNLYKQARNAKNKGDYEGASNLYQQILLREPNSWEAAFFSVSCNSRCSVGAIENACNAVRLCLAGVFDMIDALQNSQKQNAVKTVVTDACLFAVNMFDAAVKHHASINASVMSQHNNELKQQLVSATNIVVSCASLVMNRYGDEPEIAAVVETPAKCALELQSRQQFVSIVLEPDTSRTLLEWIGRFNPEYVENYKKKQNRAMASGTVFLMVLGAIFLALGLLLEGVFAKWFCVPMAIFCLGFGILRLIVQAANKKLNG